MFERIGTVIENSMKIVFETSSCGVNSFGIMQSSPELQEKAHLAFETIKESQNELPKLHEVNEQAYISKLKDLEKLLKHYRSIMDYLPQEYDTLVAIFNRYIF